MNTKYQTNKKVLVYCRESRDDYGEKYERIETQRDILLSYCKRQGLTNIVDVIMDDNVTGTSFKRMDDIKRRMADGEIDIFICKDASRLGRNLLESLEFIQFAEDNDVTILFESEEFNPELFPLIAWFNERRAKDDSDKIRHVLRHKLENGLVISAPYGYVKKEGQLVPDEDTAPVVRKIFDMSCNGSTPPQISDYLNIIRAPSPSKGNKSFNTVINPIWTADNVRRILQNPSYTGLQVSCKRRKVSFKSKRYTVVPEEERIYIENHHEALISKDVFDYVQLSIRSFKIPSRKPANNPFSGLLRCGRCGKSVLVRSRHEGKPYKYMCGKYNREGGIKDNVRENWGCNPHEVYYEDLCGTISGYVGHFLDDKLFRQSVLDTINQNSQDSKIQQQIDNLKKREDALKKRFDILYEDKLRGILPDFMFVEKAQTVKAEIERVHNQTEMLKSELAHVTKLDSVSEYEKLMKKIHDDGISPEGLAVLFNEIIVYEPGEITEAVKEEYRICEEQFGKLYNEGGLLFVQKAPWGNIIH